jgi:3-phenylpropionate/cinnamic acid dioxygenase small subunit
MADLNTQPHATAARALSPTDELLLVRELERFVAFELNLLDGREFEAWCDLFTIDGIYWAPSRVEQDDPLGEVSLLYDDHEIREMRFLRLRHPRVHAQVPFSRTSHMIGNLAIDEVNEDRGEIAFHCRFVMHDYRPEWAQREFAGRYDYRLVRDGSSLKIKLKKATVINCDAMHFPISIPL